MSIEAMKQALEALEKDSPWREETITFLRQAIEQAEKMEMFKEYGEGWESLAWELCADECGEEACTELIWEGVPIPEPWGDRWLKYEDEAKRLIALVQKHTTPQPQQAEKQEPVAYPEGYVVGPCICGSWPGGKCLKCPRITPQPQREWVGLTDEEIALVCAQCAASAHNWNDISFARAIEQALKEKNT